MVNERSGWATVYVGPVWKALAIQSMLDEAGFLTQVPDASANLGAEFVVVQGVLVPESEFVAARSAIETYETSAEPRSA